MRRGNNWWRLRGGGSVTECSQVCWGSGVPLRLGSALSADTAFAGQARGEFEDDPQSARLFELSQLR